MRMEPTSMISKCPHCEQKGDFLTSVTPLKVSGITSPSKFKVIRCMACMKIVDIPTLTMNLIKEIFTSKLKELGKEFPDVETIIADSNRKANY